MDPRSPSIFHILHMEYQRIPNTAGRLRTHPPNRGETDRKEGPLAIRSATGGALASIDGDEVRAVGPAQARDLRHHPELERARGAVSRRPAPDDPLEGLPVLLARPQRGPDSLPLRCLVAPDVGRDLFVPQRLDRVQHARAPGGIE